MMFRLLVVDIDGTITDGQRRLSLQAVEAVRRAEAAGLPVSLASGNVLPFVEAAAVLIGTSGPLIAEDGGAIAIGREVRFLGGREEVDRALEVLRAELGVVETRSSRLRVAGATIERTVGVEEVRRVLASHGFNLVAVDSGFAIHIKEPHVNKGNALRAVAESLGISTDEIVAVADGPNDVELLRCAGLGFAVANSPEEVKRAAGRVTGLPDGAGVAEIVDMILGGKIKPSRVNL